MTRRDGLVASLTDDLVMRRQKQQFTVLDQTIHADLRSGQFFLHDHVIFSGVLQRFQKSFLQFRFLPDRGDTAASGAVHAFDHNRISDALRCINGFFQ